ncbi:1-aminocyclopropane-1-carboxylate deaminase/D-cysteine desulfhydrase [Robertkochia solimangrovi]|uniref:1-aminocyclopropane-1-carboxylate deaminase/D-cysteine desulfhydrase n=1 Tax=Robertkochia solimangrovi TaxID=2213046 RepID=UPI00117C31B3|nr:pyridoxal-phosphate dependent enzyme [Robertkochia solimangrovi]TRZ43094.1 1-aminocyclopropane-1-carboxylate deaminase/D-cysteine desulfhydrase [Robertkochia solimangrovi]
MNLKSLHLQHQEIHLEKLERYGIRLVIKREDLIHPFVSGNKYRKLKYNLVELQEKGYAKLLTFGGAYSNHIAATAYAAKEQGVKAIGVIRGEELKAKAGENPTLNFARKQGMELHFVSREIYRTKTQPMFLESLYRRFGDFYLLPEGGTNALAVKGCEEILVEKDSAFDYICCAVGTGGTISGLINASTVHQKVLGFPALKGSFLKNEICNFVSGKNWELIEDYHFGGYAKISASLVNFINVFKEQTAIPLDPVYTGKMIYGILDLAEKGYFSRGSSILAIHTGGLQGIPGMNQILKRKQLPLIQ